MTAPISKARVIQDVREAHASFHRAAAGLPEDALIQSGVEADWSAKDIAAHVEYWQRRAIFYLECARDGWNDHANLWASGPVDNQNARNYENNQAKSVQEVLDTLAASESRVVSLLNSTSEEDLFTTDRFPWLPGESVVDRIAGETYEHYQEHLDSLWGWRVGRLHGDTRTLDRLVDEIEYAHARINRLLINLSNQQTETSGAEGVWSVKDVLVHLTYWEQNTASQLEALRTGGNPVSGDEDSTQTVNDRVYEQNRSRPLTDVLADFASAHQYILAELSQLGPDALTESFAWSDGDSLWDHIASETFQHFNDHYTNILAWMSGQNIHI